MRAEEVSDCKQEGCGECDVCLYLDFLEWCGQVGGGAPSVIERDGNVEAYLNLTYPHWRHGRPTG